MHAPLFRLVVSLALSGAAAMSTALAAPTSRAPCDTAGSQHLTTAEGAACRLADELEKAFVYPEQGKAYAAMLRAYVAEGRYATLTPDEAAQRMTSDLQTVAADGHLRVERLSQHQRGAGGTNPNFPLMEQGGWIAPGIAFLRINAFTPEASQTAEVAKFMADHADADAIIFDLRTHRGGGLDQMDVDRKSVV